MSKSNEVYVYVDKETPIDLSSFQQNGLWELLTYSAENAADDDGDSKTKIIFKVEYMSITIYVTCLFMYLFIYLFNNK